MDLKPGGAAGRPKLILASGSPRRKELLERFGWEYELRAMDVDETVSGAPESRVAELAERKARAAAEGLDEGILLAADTLVAVDGESLGKPLDETDARRMLRLLSGRSHQVLTGVCLMDVAAGEMVTVVDVSHVRFRALGDADIEAYIQSGEPMGKAGAYGIQGPAGAFVAELEGSFENVMGLPVRLLDNLLLRLRGKE